MPQCPYYARYVFNTKCRVETCQHHTKVTEHNCLSLDRREGDKQLSVAEIGSYKSYAITRSSGSNEPLTIKGVETAVRRNMLRVRESTRLLTYLMFMDESAEKRDQVIVHSDTARELFTELSKTYTELRLWMIPLIFDPVNIRKFSRAYPTMSQEPFNLRSILGKSSPLIPSLAILAEEFKQPR